MHTTMHPSHTGRKRWHMLRLLGGVGLGLCALLALGTLGLTLMLGPMLADWLAQANMGLSRLDSNLAGLIAALEPLDVLARPETLGTVQALGELLGRVEASPFAGLLLAEGSAAGETLSGWRGQLATWEQVLGERPSVPALREQRGEVQLWLGRVELLQRWLMPTLVGLNLGAWLLGAWFGAGQWALLRLAGERLASERLINGARGLDEPNSPHIR